MAGGDHITCATHGKARTTFVCHHLVDGTALMFFAASPPSKKDPWPDAWCEKCESSRIVNGGEWNDVSEAFAQIKVICHHCYEQRRERLRRGGEARDDAGLSFEYRCGQCAELHRGLPAWGAAEPFPYQLLKAAEKKRAKLTNDTCTTRDDFFVRGCLEIPIIGSDERFVWGVWTSLSEKSFKRTMALMKDPARQHEPPYFGWVCTRLPHYPDTLSLKSHVYERAVGERPLVVLEPTNHPLAQEQQHGITVEWARELAGALLHDAGGSPHA